MNILYYVIKSRIINVINVINTYINVKIKTIAREFIVFYYRLRNRLNDVSNKITIRDLHNKLFTFN